MENNFTGSSFVIPSNEESSSYDETSLKMEIEETLSKVLDFMTEKEILDPFMYCYLTNSLISDLIKNNKFYWKNIDPKTNAELIKIISLRIKFAQMIFGKEAIIKAFKEQSE